MSEHDTPVGAALSRFLRGYRVDIKPCAIGSREMWHVWHWLDNPFGAAVAIPCETVDEAIVAALKKAAENAARPRNTPPSCDSNFHLPPYSGTVFVYAPAVASDESEDAK